MSGRARPKTLITLVILLIAEAAVVASAAVFLLYELVTEPAASVVSAVALVVLAALAAVWLAVLAAATWRRRPWIRGGALVWQVLQLAVAVGSFQGPAPRPDIGWALAIPAVIVLVLLFTPGVLASTRREA
ncbi:hypothetical protein CLV46_0815 [Diaminobutyricimonas aerilata]|uniref:Histidine kinase n=1 Tax=Diaminobutyricimonas aerilata TaxID=1162967 RepID=A0A2M9CH81_9MICO|nr:hypothetical protein [Diaminobutyricimonas aerilata]PJJ71273.1 hypothetical protein CLV46_0815 [Diaminobutyricimonas aerilata]